MTDVGKIQVSLRTGVGPKDAMGRVTGGTDGEVFLFIGGREFRINRAKDADGEDYNDRLPGHSDRVILGEGTNAVDPQSNDPRTPYGKDSKALVLEDLKNYPMWLRFEPLDATDNWFLDHALVEVFAKGSSAAKQKYEILQGENKNLWLGKKLGLHVSLQPPQSSPTPVHPTTEPEFEP